MGICVEAWHDLGADRQLGFGVAGDIPRRAVRGFARDEELDADAFRIIWGVIRFLDAERKEREASRRELEEGGSR